MKYSNLEVKVKGFLRTALSAEASTTTLDIDWVKEDDPNTAVSIQSDSLMFEIDPLGKTGKVGEICLSTSVAAHASVTGRTTHTTTARGLTREGHEQTGAASRANSWDEGTEVAFATGSMAKMVSKLINEVSAAFPSDGAVLQLVMYADATARDAAITTPINGMICGLTDTGVNYQYIGGTWTTFASGTTANGSAAVAGKFEEATVAEQGTSTATGDTGARLVPACENLVKTGTFTPAFLTGGGAATSVIGTWTAVADGTFTISIDGTAYDITAVDFSTPDADMDAVAATIQAKIRTATSSTETVVWSTDHFIISSVDTTSSSAITVTSAEGSGTDISGAGGTTFMDCETAVGTVTAKVYDHENKIVVMGSDGLDSENLEANYRGMATGTTNITGTELEDLTNGSDASDKHYHTDDPQKYWRQYPLTIGWGSVSADTLNWSPANNGAGSTTIFAPEGFVNLATAAQNGAYESYYRYLTPHKTLLDGAATYFSFDDFSDGDVIIFRCGCVAVGTANEVRFGLGEDLSDAYNDVGSKCVAKFKIDDTQVSVVTCDGTGAVTNTNITVSNVNYFHVYEIVYTVGTSVVFKVDNVVMNTSTTNIPLKTDTGAVVIFEGNKATSATAKTVKFDNEPYIAVYQQ